MANNLRKVGISESVCKIVEKYIGTEIDDVSEAEFSELLENNKQRVLNH
jgi:hypothetical protein